MTDENTPQVMAPYGLATLDFDETTFTGTFRARNGREVRVRLITPQDWPLLVDLFYHLSPETRWRRFHTAAVEDPEPERVASMAQQLANVDNRTQGGAVLALTEEDGREVLLGVGRLARPPEQPDASEAEAAIVVRDDWHGQGVGTVLMALLIALARRMGVRQIYGYVQADNTPLFQVLDGLDEVMEIRVEGGEALLRLPLDRLPPLVPRRTQAP